MRAFTEIATKVVKSRYFSGGHRFACFLCVPYYHNFYLDGPGDVQEMRKEKKERPGIREMDMCASWFNQTVKAT